MTTVLLGNAAPLMADGSPARTTDGQPIGNTITVVGMRDDWRDEDVSRLAVSTRNDPQLNAIADLLDDADHGLAVGVLEINDLWNAGHSQDPPEWVEVPGDDDFARVLAEWFSSEPARMFNRWTVPAGHECAVGRPDGWDDTLSAPARLALSLVNARTPDVDVISNPVDVPPPIAGGSLELDRLGLHGLDVLGARWREHELLTTAGRDALHPQHLGGGGAPAQPAPFAYLAVANSASATAPAAGDTVLTGEITTAGGGLLRGQATYAHTAGTNVTTLTRTFTANGSDSLPVTISQDGCFNASSAGTLGYKSALASNATLNAAGDSVALTRTLTIG